MAKTLILQPDELQALQSAMKATLQSSDVAQMIFKDPSAIRAARRLMRKTEWAEQGEDVA